MAYSPKANETYSLSLERINARDYGITPDTADCGPLIASLPTFVEVWFETGTYTFLTSPTLSQWANRTYRGLATTWNSVSVSPGVPYTNITSSLTGTPRSPTAPNDDQVFFSWNFQSASDGYGTGLGAISPLEGIIISGQATESIAYGVGVKFFGTPGWFFMIIPKKFAVQNWGVGVLLDGNNLFCTGLEDCTIYTSWVGILYLKNSNSGSTFRFKRNFTHACYLTCVSVQGPGLLQVIWENHIADYSPSFGYYNGQHIFMNCYYENNAVTIGTTEVFSMVGECQLLFDKTMFVWTSVTPNTGFFELTDFTKGGVELTDCTWTSSDQLGDRASNQIWSRPLTRATSYACVTVNKHWGNNNGIYPSMFSEYQNLIYDGFFDKGDFTYWPGSTTDGCSFVANTHDNRYTNMLQITGTTASISSMKFAVSQGPLYYAFWENVVSTSAWNDPTLTFYAADGTTAIPVISPRPFDPGTNYNVINGGGGVHGWQLYRYAVNVPNGAAMAQIVFTIDGGNTGTWQISEVCVFQ
jgi:hypothetical protein